MRVTVSTFLLVSASTFITIPYAASFSPSSATTSSSTKGRGSSSLRPFAIVPAGGNSFRISNTGAGTKSNTSLSLVSRDCSKSNGRAFSILCSPPPHSIRKRTSREENVGPTGAVALKAMNKDKTVGTTTGENVVPGIGPEGCALPSPSRVNTLPEPVQAIIVLAIFVTLGVSSVAFSSLLDDITLKYEWFQTWRYTWPLLGFIYMAAGVTHFTLESEYINIYPQKGAWGFWYLPGSPKFHVQWTGIAEILGGLGLVIGGAYDAFMPVWGECPNVLTSAGIGSDAAAGLLLLTAAVTPANVYMYTHGAKLPMDGPDVPVVGHLIRGIMQVILFGLLYQIGQGSFDAILMSS